MKDALLELAYDLWWTTEPDAAAVFRDLDPDRWEEVHHNPVAQLHDTDPDAAPASWKERAKRLLEARAAYFEARKQRVGPKVAYFCMEFGLHESVPFYSGGLGVLSGDHLRSASDLALDLVAVGLLYREGYFTQIIHDGKQVAAYPTADPARLPLRPVNDAKGRRIVIHVPHGHHFYTAQAWSLQIGVVTLYLLDADFNGNPLEHRTLSRQLYGGNQETRIAQEVLLGIGGVKLLEEMGIEPDVYHMNEGHSSFLTLELWAREIQQGVDAAVAWEKVRKHCVFTTHTPVPAGHDRFNWDVVRPALGGYRERLGLQEGAFMDHGRTSPGDIQEPLCMTTLALRGSRTANGVSKLHGEVSRDMWKRLGEDIGAITNGVHPTAWLAPEMARFWDDHLHGWRGSFEDPAFWSQAEKLPSAGLLAVRKTLRKRLVAEVRRTLGRDVLDGDALTLGFARRFAPYKRATLLFSDPDRLVALLERGVQIVFAGKAHPQDLHGQAILADVVRRTREPRFRRSIVFLSDYDIAIGRLLTQGCDVWMNTPRRPREASGTSGQKAALNGNPNCSVLDGWWPEAYDGDNGWAIGDDRTWSKVEDQDAADSLSLYSVLEDQVLPAFEDPKGWAKRMGHVLATCVPKFNTNRMVRDYLTKLYKDPGRTSK